MTLSQFAATEAHESQGLLEALGIDVQLLIVQLISFLVLFWLLKKFVYPTFVKSIDDRQAKIDESVKAAEQASKAAAKAEQDTEAVMKTAKAEAAEVLALAQKKAAKVVEEAGAKAEKKAQHIVDQAQARVSIDIAEAKKSLESEMVSLVAAATEKVVQQKIDAQTDMALIKKALDEAK